MAFNDEITKAEATVFLVSRPANADPKICHDQILGNLGNLIVLY